MSGYLKRLASSVLQPGGSIHPVLAPMFSPARENISWDGLREESVQEPVRPASGLHKERSPAAAAQPAAPTPAREPETLGDTETEPRSPIISRARSASIASPPASPFSAEKIADAQPISEEMREFRPLLRPSAVENVARPASRSLAMAPEPGAIESPWHLRSIDRAAREELQTGSPPPPASRAEKFVPAPAAFDAQRELQPDGQEQPFVVDSSQPAKNREPERALRDRFVPLVSEPQNLSNATAILPKMSTALPPALRNDARAEMEARAVQREPDEILIHIGRIEVTAAPPAPPRAAAKPARKSLTLDDYLKRRHGRPS